MRMFNGFFDRNHRLGHVFFFPFLFGDGCGVWYLNQEYNLFFSLTQSP